MYKILEPIKIGNLELDNRLAFIAMSKHLSTDDFFATDREIAYYANQAKNGVGLIITGACIIDPNYPSVLKNQIGIYDDEHLPCMKKLVDEVHKYGGKIFFQPWHPGACNYNCTVEEVKTCADWTVDEIHALQDKFVECIERIKRSGADGCEFHIAHNYLPEQFLTPLFNKRTDEYGADTVENGLRFSTEILKRAREVCGKDFPLTVKINGWDMGFEGGMTPERCAEAAVLLEQAGAQMIAVSAGGSLTDITGMSGDGYREEGWKIDYAKTVKEKVSIPVMATGSIRHMDVIEGALADGIDMIGMGRGLLAEPEFVVKLKEGRENELRYCLSCMSCFNLDLPTGQHCSMNPCATWEIDEPELVNDGDGRTVVVVGAGPAGITAAITLAKRGFKPVVFEKTGRVGGSVRYASTPDGKAKLAWAIDYYHREITRLGIPVYLNTEATVENIKALEPYAVFLATGSNPIFPAKIPGITGANVYQARNVLDCVPAYTDEKIVVIGGGMVGLEVATLFKHRGCEAAIVEMQPEDKMPAVMTYTVALAHAKRDGVELNYGHKLVEITESAVIAENMNGEQVAIPATKVILCMGFRPETTLFDALSESMERVYKMGDANMVDNIARATREGFMAAAKL